MKYGFVSFFFQMTELFHSFTGFITQLHVVILSRILLTNFFRTTVTNIINPLTPNDLQRRRAVTPLKIKVPTKKSQQAALRGGI
jgi:hypothetical protein